MCWGDNEAGEATPPDGETFVSISAGSDFTCALRADGIPICWGRPDARWDYGQADPPEGERFVQIACGQYHTCGLRQDGVAVCWGPDLGDEVDYNDIHTFQAGFGQTAAPPDERFVTIIAGSNHNCGLKVDGTPVCWGSGFPGP